MLGNECSGYATGDAICINGTTSTAKFIIETGAALYVYNNPSAEDVDNDICVKDGSAITPTVNADAIFSTDAPQVVALSSILTTLGICTMKAKKKKKGGVYEKSKK